MRIGVIGLGYVGLPLAVEFARKYPVVGYDINHQRIDQLNQGVDVTREVEPDELAAADQLAFTANEQDIRDCNIFIITVPTPIDSFCRPDLGPLKSASKAVGAILKPGDTVIYESTVYPGCTEEECIPILEAESGLTCAISGQGENLANQVTDSKHFQVGYSPERINPGDKQHCLPDIQKVTSGSSPEAAEFVNRLYASIITAGTHQAPSIRVAEAAKVIENTQRDVNIGLVNELAMLFARLGLDTGAVLEAAATKWNFLPFRPGLVGGHCIGVDPYYLTHKAQQIGFHPQMILAGRRTNDGMGPFVAAEVLKLMARKGSYQLGARVLVLGLTFKENCPDLRNTRVVDLIESLKGYCLEVDVHDPWADPVEALQEYGLELVPDPPAESYAAVVLAVAHKEFAALGNPGIRKYARGNAVIYDLKHILPVEITDGRL